MNDGKLAGGQPLPLILVRSGAGLLGGGAWLCQTERPAMTARWTDGVPGGGPNPLALSGGVP